MEPDEVLRAGGPSSTAPQPEAGMDDELFEPFAVYDDEEDSWRALTPDQRIELCSWWRQQGVELAIAAHRIEVYLIDAPFARIYEWDDHCPLDHAHDPFDVVLDHPPRCVLAQRDPYILVLPELPPVPPGRRVRAAHRAPVRQAQLHMLLRMRESQ